MTDVRKATNKLIDMMDEGRIDPSDLAKNLMGYMSEADVADFAQYNEYFFDSEDEDEDEREEG